MITRNAFGLCAPVLLCGLVLVAGCNQSSQNGVGGNPTQQAQNLVDAQIKHVQESKYLTQAQKDEQIQRIRAMNQKIGQSAPGGH